MLLWQYMEKIRIVYKKKGQTPLAVIKELKETDQNLRMVPLTYAGRLDPLAEGVLLVLCGNECHKKDEYLALPKEYEVTILFGFSTDTYDVLGKVIQSVPLESQFEKSSDPLGQSFLTDRGQTISNQPSDSTTSSNLKGLVFATESLNTFSVSGDSLRGSETVLSDEVARVLSRFTGRITQAYPPYSSRTVDGKPLFQWAREGKLDQITIPSHEVFVESIELLKVGSTTGVKLHRKITKDIATVVGDFRQEEILKLWNDTLESKRDAVFQTITIKIRCGSGVYVRSIAHELGIALGVPTLALDIVRIKVGEYTIADTKK